MSSSSFLSSFHSSNTTKLKVKENEIEKVLGNDLNNVDLWKLRELALSDGGLINDSIRKRAWTLLVGIYNDDISLEEKSKAIKEQGLKRVTSRESKDNWRRPKRHRPNHLQKLCTKEEEGKFSSKTRDFSFSTITTATAASSSSTLPSPEETTAVTREEGEVNNTDTNDEKNNTLPFLSLDAQQIELDVARCTAHLFSECERMNHRELTRKNKKNHFLIESLLKEKQKRLGNLINLALLRTYEDEGNDSSSKLRYYQGYHDVASILLSTLDEESTLESPSTSPSPSSPTTATGITKDMNCGDVEDNDADSVVNHVASSMGLGLCCNVLTQISKSHLGDATKTDFLQLRTAIQLVWMPLLNHFDSEVHDYLAACEMEPFFLLSWIITWFSHDIRDTSLVKRLFDVFLVSHPLFSIYLALAMVCHHNNREEILMTECDFAALHVTLSNLPKNSDTIEISSINNNDYYSFDSSSAEDYLVGTEAGKDDDPSLSNSSMHVKKKGDSDVGDVICDETPSLAPTSQLIDGSSCSGVKAPFQELIDLALKFMERVPPSCVLNISHNYYMEDQFEPMMSIAPMIVMLKPHPWWGLVATPQEGEDLLEDMSLPCGVMGRRRVHGHQQQQSLRTKIALEVDRDDNNNIVSVHWHSKNPAVIACGYGRGERVFLNHRTLKRFALLSAAFIAFVPSNYITEITKQLDFNHHFLSSYLENMGFGTIGNVALENMDTNTMGLAAGGSCLLEDYDLSFLATSLSTCDIH